MENAAIVYMTRKNDLWVFKHSINFLYKNFNREANYPVIVFYDDLTKIDIANLLTEINLSLGFMPDIKFEKLEFILPKGISQDPTLYSPSLDQFRMGYRHMCRFYGGQIFNHKVLAKYKWYMRLDSDSFVLTKISKDPFTTMRENEYGYAHMENIGYDAPWACEGLWETTKKFMNENSEKLINKNFDWNFEVYNTNFEIVDMDFYRSQNYQNYFNYLEQTNNIFYKRWGDHCIRWLGSTMFMNSNKIWAVKEFAYQHGGDVNNTHLINEECVQSVPEPYKKSVLAALSKLVRN